MMLKTFLPLLFLNSLLQAQPSDTLATHYAKTLLAEDMSKNLHVLASDAYEGRETGQKGQKMAAWYIAQQFKNAGIPPYKDTTYYQEFSLNVILPKPAEISINGKKYEGNKDYFNFPGLGEQTIQANSILFLGYGIEEKNYNDYQGQQVKDKVLMVLAGEPLMPDSSSLITGSKKLSPWTTYYKAKIEKARESGAKALLIVVDDVAKGIENNRHRLESSSMKLSLNTPEMPVIYISRAMADAVLKKQHNADIIKNIASKKQPYCREAKASFVLSIQNNVQKIGSENVLAYIEGSDLKDQLVVVTAHYDHLGKDGDVVYNGADDDGSGTVAVIELAQAFAKAKKEGHGPRRSMLFMTVAGEEKGLLGSSYYSENPVFPLDKTVCDLNIDMIGRLDDRHPNDPNYVYIIGSDKLSSTLHSINEHNNALYTQLKLDYTYNDENDKNRFYYRSDHYNFAKKGIPVIFYFNGTHADYHKETDEVEKIDFKKMEKISRLVFYNAWELANRDQRIVVDSNKK